MIFHLFKSIVKSQRGFTLIEVLVATLITGILGYGATMATVQLITQNTRNNDYTIASRNVNNVLYWISYDAQMSQTIDTGEAAGFPLTMGWTEWDNSEHEVIYSIDGDKIRRSYSVDAGNATVTLVAQYINSISENTTADFTDSVLTVKVTSTVGTGSREFSLTKVRQITPRPSI